MLCLRMLSNNLREDAMVKIVGGGSFDSDFGLSTSRRPPFLFNFKWRFS